MKKRILFSIPIGLLVFYGQSQIGAQNQCEQQAIPAACSGAGGITINTNTKNISPRNLCASSGETISVNVVPAGSTVRIEGKRGGWPSGSGSSFTITAPSSGNYDYNVFFPDNTCIDPRISVGGR